MCTQKAINKNKKKALIMKMVLLCNICVCVYESVVVDEPFVFYVMTHRRTRH